MVHKKIIITVFVAVQLILIFFYIYTQSIIIKLTYSFQDADRTFQELQKRKDRDQEKKYLCEKNGIKLIIIPHWWNQQLESLKATIERSF